MGCGAVRNSQRKLSEHSICIVNLILVKKRGHYGIYRNLSVSLVPPMVHSIGCKNGLSVLFPAAETDGIVTLPRAPL